MKISQSTLIATPMCISIRVSDFFSGTLEWETKYAKNRISRWCQQEIKMSLGG